MLTVDLSVGDVTVVTDPSVVDVTRVSFSTNGLPVATVVDQTIKIDAGLNETGVIYFIIDDGTQTIIPDETDTANSTSTDDENLNLRFLQETNTTEPATTTTPNTTDKDNTTTSNTTKPEDNSTTTPEPAPTEEIEAEELSWSKIVY